MYGVYRVKNTWMSVKGYWRKGKSGSDWYIGDDPVVEPYHLLIPEEFL